MLQVFQLTPYVDNEISLCGLDRLIKENEKELRQKIEVFCEITHRTWKSTPSR